MRGGEIVAHADEFVGSREAARNLYALLDRLSSGENRVFVILARNRPRGVLLSIEEYERLLGAARSEEAS